MKAESWIAWATPIETARVWVTWGDRTMRPSNAQPASGTDLCWEHRSHRRCRRPLKPMTKPPTLASTQKTGSDQTTPTIGK